MTFFMAMKAKLSKAPCISTDITGHSEPRQSTPEEYGIPVIPGRQNQIFLKSPSRELVHLLNVCHPGRSACRLLIISRGFAAFVCPSNLCEYSLVLLLFFQNLHWVFGYGLQCFGTRRYFWQHSCFRKLQFLLHNQFLPIFKLKKSEFPRTRLVSRGFPKFLYFK